MIRWLLLWLAVFLLLEALVTGSCTVNISGGLISMVVIFIIVRWIFKKLFS